MSWDWIHNVGEELELWTTIIVNSFAIFTGLIIAGKRIVARVPIDSEVLKISAWQALQVVLVLVISGALALLLGMLLGSLLIGTFVQ